MVKLLCSGGGGAGAGGHTRPGRSGAAQAVSLFLSLLTCSQPSPACSSTCCHPARQQASLSARAGLLRTRRTGPASALEGNCECGERERERRETDWNYKIQFTPMEVPARHAGRENNRCLDKITKTINFLDLNFLSFQIL